MAKKLKLNVFKIRQSERNLYLASIRAKDFTDETMFKIDFWEPEKLKKCDQKNQGYQRKPSLSRIKEIATFLETKNPSFPTSILLSTRKPVEATNYSVGSGYTMIVDPPLYIVDGQHRIAGIRHSIKEKNNKDIQNFQLPVIIMETKDKIDEVRQFDTLNTKQKRVSTDLAQRLLQGMILERPESFDKIPWQIKALKTLDLLNQQEDSPWYDRIRLPNEDKTAAHIVSQNSMITSLKPLFDDGLFSSRTISVDFSYEILKNYWLALKDIFEDAFLAPKDYVIRKTPGVFALHSLLHEIDKLARISKRPEDYKREFFREVLTKTFNKFEGTKNPGLISDFWRSDYDMGASQYGSMKGFKILADQLKDCLPVEFLDGQDQMIKDGVDNLIRQ